MRFLAKLGTLVAGLCLGYILSGAIGLIVSRGDATKALVVAVVVVAVCSFMSGFNRKPTTKKRW
jgi:hypothetical protein